MAQILEKLVEPSSSPGVSCNVLYKGSIPKILAGVPLRIRRRFAALHPLLRLDRQMRQDLVFEILFNLPATKKCLPPHNSSSGRFHGLRYGLDERLPAGLFIG